MARAKRHYTPGHVWHITHRCHKREFLLKFAMDRRRWLQWLREARRRYNINYLVVADDCSIRDSMWTQSIAVGSEKFIERTKETLGIRAKGRKVVESGELFQLRESEVSYYVDFGIKNNDIGYKNSYLWYNDLNISK